MRWVVTSFSVATLPNTIIIGVPLIGGMYGRESKGLMKQILVLQFCVWYSVVIFLYECMRAGVDGTAKISPSPVEAAAAAADVSRERSQEMTVDIQVTGVVDEVGMCGDQAEDVTLPAVKHVFLIAVKKILRIPNTYGGFLGLIWALVAFRCGIKMPKIIDDSLFIIDSTAAGLCMFSSGTFIARQSRLVPCGYKIASLAMILKFLICPVMMLVASLVVGLRGTLLHIAVVQAALPLSLASFLYAEEYKVHADVMSTGSVS
uniref:Auxin efflux carrier component n=1 Tax=Leersia perrieri TaxID=77586 RepID=A0A0D9WXT7_9ORYZ